MNQYKEIVHFLKFHKYEMFLALVIYAGALFPSFMLVEMLLKSGKSIYQVEWILMLPAIPFALYTEYSYRKLGYIKTVSYAIYSFFLVNFLLLAFENSARGIFPAYYGYGVFFALLASGPFVVDIGKCPCRKDLEQ
jgi:hypothetical protein